MCDIYYHYIVVPCYNTHNITLGDNMYIENYIYMYIHTPQVL